VDAEGPCGNISWKVTETRQKCGTGAQPKDWIGKSPVPRSIPRHLRNRQGNEGRNAKCGFSRDYKTKKLKKRPRPHIVQDDEHDKLMNMSPSINTPGIQDKIAPAEGAHEGASVNSAEETQDELPSDSRTIDHNQPSLRRSHRQRRMTSRMIESIELEEMDSPTNLQDHMQMAINLHAIKYENEDEIFWTQNMCYQ
jgi:hypothetical protein